MMTSSNWNIFRDTCHLCAHKGQWREASMFSLICAWINDLVNNDDAGDLRLHRAHNDDTVHNGWKQLRLFSVGMETTENPVSRWMEWCNFYIMTSSNGHIFRVTLPLYGKPQVTGGFPSQSDSYADLWCFVVVNHNKMLNKLDGPVIPDVMTVIWRRRDETRKGSVSKGLNCSKRGWADI